MGLGNNTSGVFLNIANGKIVRRFKEATKKTVPRVLTKGPNAGSTVHEEHYDFVQGRIVDIFLKKSDYGKTWNFVIKDGDDEFILQLDYSSGYTSALLKTLPNVSLDQPVKLSPKLTVVDDKKKATVFVNQGGEPVKWFFTKENPHDLPGLEKVRFKGEEVWDDSKMMAYLEDMVMTKIVPFLVGSDIQRSSTDHLDEKTQTEVDQFDPGDEPQGQSSNDPSKDDLPF